MLCNYIIETILTITTPITALQHWLGISCYSSSLTPEPPILNIPNLPSSWTSQPSAPPILLIIASVLFGFRTGHLKLKSLTAQEEVCRVNAEVRLRGRSSDLSLLCWLFLLARGQAEWRVAGAYLPARRTEIHCSRLCVGPSSLDV
jgi:hypothetical protein